MNRPPPSDTELLEEIAALRARLEEAEETLRAIRSGEVDALVMGEEVYTLKGAERPYRSLIEEMCEGAAMLAEDGTVLYANRRLAAMLRVPLQDLIASALRRFVAPGDAAVFDALLAQGRQGSGTGELSLRCLDGSAVPVQLSCSVLAAPGAPVVCLVATDLTEHKRADRALQQAHDTLEQRVAERTAQLSQSEERHRRLAQCMLQGVVCQAADGTILDMNPAAERILGRTRQEFLGSSSVGEERHTIREDGSPFPGQEHPAMVALRTGQPAQAVVMGVWNPIEEVYRWIRIDAAPVFQPGETRPVETCTVFEDITERKRADERLRGSLREKEVLLQEVHHRVKNNLQVISSLISLQSAGLNDPALRAELDDVRDRVRTMAMVHEKLYQSPDLAQLNFEEYASSLVHYLQGAHGKAAASVRVVLATQPARLPVAIAVPCGLILNELASNAFKHAFSGRTGGELTVGLEHDPASNQICLRVSDDGPGLPPNLDWRQSSTLGLRLVQMLSHQLGGTVELRSGPGTEFRVTFPAPAAS